VSADVGLPVHLALIAVQVLFGLWPVAGSAVMTRVSPAAVVGFRTLLAAPILFAGAAAAGSRPWRVSARDLGALAILAVLGVSANQLLYAEGLHRAGAVNAAVLVGMMPALTLLFAILLRAERATRTHLIGVGLALIGAAAIVRVDRFELDRALSGDLLLVANTSCYALYLVLARRLVARVGAFPVAAWVFVLGALGALPWTGPAIAATPWQDLPRWAYGSLAFILLGPTVLTYFLNAYALRRADSSLVGVYTSLQPVIGAGAARLVLGQEITARTAIAGSVILIGVIVSARR
jgi:drug/metabolite transporter (DMT)-like permease